MADVFEAESQLSSGGGDDSETASVLGSHTLADRKEVAHCPIISSRPSFRYAHCSSRFAKDLSGVEGRQEERAQGRRGGSGELELVTLILGTELASSVELDNTHGGWTSCVLFTLILSSRGEQSRHELRTGEGSRRTSTGEQRAGTIC